VEPDPFVTWMGAGAELDPRPGGRFRIEVDPHNVALGQYVEVDPPRRLVLTWGWEHHPTVPPGSTTVEITLLQEGSATILRLRHMGLPGDEDRRSHAEGWAHFMGRLAERAGSES
jgi:uncharacterized protein YndB with AHSA1/START domain